MGLFNRKNEIQKLEVSEKHVGLRFALVILLLVVGLGCIAFALIGLLGEEPGWQIVELDDQNYMDEGEFTLYYDLGQGELSATEEKRELQKVYGNEMMRVYRLFDALRSYDGINNISYINQHPNEILTVDVTLYRAFSLLETYGDRSVFLAPLQTQYRNLFSSDSDTNADTLNGNVNIKITGGIWDGNNTAPENAKPDLFDKEGYSGATLNFVRVQGLALADMVLANSVTYYVRMSGVHHFTIENIDFVSDTFGVNQDGLHIGGDVRHGRVKNIRALSFGQTNDDMVALNADDSIERVENLDLCRDAIEDITFENIYTENCHTIIRMLSVTAPIRDIHFRNVYGGFRCNAINADAARYCRTPLFNEDAYPQGVGEICNVTFENFTCFPVLQLPQGFGGTQGVPRVALTMEAHMDHFTINNFHYPDDPQVTARCPALRVANLTNARVTADGTVHTIRKKEDVVQVERFENLSVCKQ